MLERLADIVNIFSLVACITFTSIDSTFVLCLGWEEKRLKTCWFLLALIINAVFGNRELKFSPDTLKFKVLHKEARICIFGPERETNGLTVPFSIKWDPLLMLPSPFLFLKWIEIVKFSIQLNGTKNRSFENVWCSQGLLSVRLRQNHFRFLLGATCEEFLEVVCRDGDIFFFFLIVFFLHISEKIL